MMRGSRAGGVVLVLAPLLGMACAAVDIAREILEPSGVWYVAVEGQDIRDCLTPETACQTVQAAVDKADPDGEIRILPGNFVEPPIHINKPLRVFGAGLEATTVRTPGAGPVFLLGDSPFDEDAPPPVPPTIFLMGLTVVGGYNGAVMNNGATAYLTDLRVTDTEAGLSASIDNTAGSTLYLTDVALLDSRAAPSAACGAVYNRGELTLRRVHVVGGQAGGATICNVETGELLIADSRIEDAQAAGVYNGAGSSARIVGSVLEGNRDDRWGGGISNEGTLLLIGSTVHGNEAALGGGVFNRGSLTAERVTLSENRAGAAAAFYNDAGASARLVNVTISGNTASDPLSGAIVTLGSLSLEFTTITDNAAYGLLMDIDHPPPTARSTIFGPNADRDCVVQIDVTVEEHAVLTAVVDSLGWNLETDNRCTLDHPTDRRRTNPRLLPLADNGGSVQTHALSPESPALDRGGDCEGVDARGVSRPQSESCDIGAYESEIARVATSGEAPRGISTGPLTCRLGPGTAYPPVDFFVTGAELELHARNPETMWLEVSLAGATPRCWVNANRLRIDPGLDLSQLPIGEFPPLPSPTSIPTAGEPAEGCWHQRPNDNQPVCTFPCPANPSPGGACTP